MTELAPREVRELARTLDHIRRQLQYERIMAVSKLYAWWAAAGLLGGGVSLAIDLSPVPPQILGLLHGSLWLTVAALITRAFAENLARVEELERTLSLAPPRGWTTGGRAVPAAWALSFAAGGALAALLGRAMELPISGRLVIALCSALGLGNVSMWAILRSRGGDPGGEPAWVGAANLAAIPPLLSIESQLVQYVAMLLVISLSYALASLSYALRARRVLVGGR